MTLGTEIKVARIRAKLTQEELAQKLFCDRAIISRIENDRAEVSDERLRALSEIIGLQAKASNNLYELVGGSVGESYFRSYCWAETEEQAIRMHIEHIGGMPTEVLFLFSGDEAPFITESSDCGFERSQRLQELS